ncbi:MAG: Y-family DNA polymerase [Proteobacteria bacterium]|nr:Y-family DNA polymerase [Pseudomonadota bacterium]
MFALIDCNNFFVSCERVFRPELENKPVIVLSSNDGCAISRSNEAKLLGIPMGAPLFEIRHLVKAYNVEVLSCNFELYGDISSRIMSILQQQCEKVEVYSVDEAFLEYDDSVSWQTEGDRLQKHLMQCVGIPTSIGFGATKTLAKLANLQSKASGFVCYLDNTIKYHDALKAITVNKIWGIGAKLSKSLRQQAIYTAYDLMTANAKDIRKEYGIIVERIVYELNGQSCIPLTLIQDPKKSIQITRSFATPVKDMAILKQAVARYGFRLAYKLRENSQKTQTLWVYGRNTKFESANTVLHQRTIILDEPTNDTATIIQHAQSAVEDFFDPKISYSKIGIMALDLHDATLPQQKSIFTPKANDKKDIDKVMDDLNKRFGLGTVRPLSCGESIDWMNKRDHKTPAYTTNWQNIVQVKAK